ncbi:Lactose transport system permease protein LacF [Paenibacillus plantiphilus]|uniref:Lactose transport system permease protein LacF n=1 Tax=Paenibacillus plantiphilus TaxID=2905650 RepID=A0ABN8GRQ4_9BACL|nr:sugar ABC transporter permease [Paenibacillus plantiphilus]CAH1216293.1 Lactose transport system permease protein LacF [Paenibacillus plantiphilus]
MKQNNLAGYLFISPWIIGFLFFTGAPVLYTFAISGFQWDLMSTPTFIGLDNYVKMFKDPLFYQSVKVTLIYTLTSVPLQVIVAMLAAMLLNKELKAMKLFRTLIYLPSIMSGVAVAMIWSWMYNPKFGLVNDVLGWFGIAGPEWLFDEKFSLAALVLMSLWSIGGPMVIFLAGLQDIPDYMYEAAHLDGASKFRLFWHVTLPMLSPTVLFNSVMGLILSFQVFTQAYVMTGGGPSDSTLFLVLYIFLNGFKYFDMGYASTLSVVLFLMVFVLTVLQFKLSKRFVHYDR